MAAPSTAAFNHSGEWIAKGVYVTTWSVTVSGAGLAESAPHLPDKTVVLEGPTGGTSAVSFEGCNATTPTGTYFALNSAAATGGALTSLTAAGMFTILENPRWIRPHSTTATKTLTARLLSRAAL